MSADPSDVQGTQSTKLAIDPGVDVLLGIVRDALTIPLADVVPSILGQSWTWIPPYHRYSEFRMLDLWRLSRSIQFLVNVLLPTIPVSPPTFGPPLLNTFFWRPTVILQRPDQYGSYTSFPHEAWFFLNGIMTNDAAAQLNAAYLAYLFHRPITLIQNSTCGTIMDLLECALGKQWHRTTESAIQALPALYDALKSEKQRVVLIAHSQGTIIAAVVLSLLYTLTRRQTAMPPTEELLGEISAAQPYAPPEFVYPDESRFQLDDFEALTEDELAKLEVYCFANCATTMPYYRPPTDDRDPIPWIESFGNQHDIIARLGMLAPKAAKWGIVIDGPCYVRQDGWGHLLNQHYLLGIEQAQKVGRKRGGQGGGAPYELGTVDTFPDTTEPRLFTYMNGGTPANL